MKIKKHSRFELWTDEECDFLRKHFLENRVEIYRKFCLKFGDNRRTFNAFNDKRSKLGLIEEAKKNSHGSTLAKPLFSEHVKKGYIKIKIAQPNVWVFKHHYIYEQHTGHKVIPKKEMVLFLDGNNRNFDPENLYCMSKKIIGIFNNPSFGLGLVKDNAQLTRLNIMRAELILKTFERGRELGLVSGRYGVFLDKAREYQRRKRDSMTEEEKEKARIERNEKYRLLKIENPAEYERKKAIHRRWYAKNKDKINARAKEKRKALKEKEVQNEI